MTLIKKLPKVELHSHIEGTISPKTYHALACAQKISIKKSFENAANKLPSEWQELIKNKMPYFISCAEQERDYWCEPNQAWDSPMQFVAAFDLIAGIIKTADDYYLIQHANLKNLVEANTIYAETILSPSHIQSLGLDMKAVLNALKSAAQENDIENRFILTAVRHEDPVDVMAMLDYFDQNPYEMVTGYTISGGEQIGDIARYKDVFQHAHNMGLRLSAHAAEFAGAQSLSDTMEVIPHLSRVGHGVRIVESPDLIKRAKDSGLVFEVCPHSNVSLNIHNANDLSIHPILKMWDAGLMVTLNSDDAAFFGADLNKVYNEAANIIGLNETQLLQITRNAIDAAFCEEHIKVALRKKLFVPA